MKILMLWGQRKCDYPGQYAPELIEAVDEFTDEDNPDFLNEHFKEFSTDEEFSSVVIIEAIVNDEKLNQFLSNEKKQIEIISLTQI